MTYPITIENDQLRVQIFPGYGGKVASVIDKADHAELMFSYARELPTKADYDIDYADGWYAGWDECFPGIAKGAYPLHPYAGISVPDHGELWGLPTQVQPSSEGVLTRWHGIRFGYHFTRHLRLVGNALEARYTVENLAPFDFHFVWALHSLMRMNLPVEFQFGGETTWRLSHDAQGGSPNQPFTWPLCAPCEDISKPTDLPLGRGWKVFSAQPIDKPFTIAYPTRNRTLAISYESDAEVAAYWGIWISNGGWGGHKHFAVEPTTGLHDRLDESIRDHSAAKIDPMGSATWTVRWAVGNLTSAAGAACA